MIDVPSKNQRHYVIEKEIAHASKQESNNAEHSVCVKSLRKLKVRHHNTNTVNSHTSYPEADIFSISLHCSRLVKTVKDNIENYKSMP